MKIRPIAIYLPQFHPIPENDEWWGEGFTEWTNVIKAKPLFKDHYQPHLPADLGFYDLRMPGVREQQAQLAKEYGIYGFCYYHYWFNGKRILERPFQEVFESGKPDFPFMLCWANENWTRIWDGGEDNILLKQIYSAEDDRMHIRSLIPYFKDERYITINNKPVFAIYRSTLLPDPKSTLKIWREEAKQQGLELYICRFESFGNDGPEYLKDGFDAAIEFEPHKTLIDIDRRLNKSIKKRIYAKIHDKLKKNGLDNNKYRNRIIDYKKFIHTSMDGSFNKAYKKYNCVLPGFDNTARKKNDYVLLKGSTPSLFENWCAEVLSNFKPHSEEENLFFINAWNEWAEGNHLEPSVKWGHGYLKALKKALEITK